MHRCQDVGSRKRTLAEPGEGHGSRRQLLPAMSAVASEQQVPAMIFAKMHAWPRFDVEIGYTARIQQRAVEAATSVGQVQAALQVFRPFRSFTGNAGRE